LPVINLDNLKTQKERGKITSKRENQKVKKGSTRKLNTGGWFFVLLFNGFIMWYNKFMKKIIFVSIAFLILFTSLSTGCFQQGSSGGGSGLTVSFAPNPVTGYLIESGTRKKWTFSTTVYNNSSNSVTLTAQRIIIRKMDGTLYSDNSASFGPVYLNSGSSTVDPEGEITSGSEYEGGSLQPDLESGTATFTITGTFSDGSSASGSGTLTLQ
jgi:hypothetical protein